MKNKFLLVMILTTIVISTFAQNTNELYFPREYKSAYIYETRSHKGIPGINYFQNRANYNIKAELFPENNQLKGKETLTYYNNSPDTLSKIYISLYQNRFKKGEARDTYVDTKNIHDGVKIKSIKIDNTEINLENCTYYSTILAFFIPDNILPNSITTIDIEWEQQMPVTGMFRIGTYNKNNFFVGYWYPKINVYDDIVGWSTFGHTGNAEFYNDYGNFDIEITVPSEYNVWSSGRLQNPKELFEEKYIKRIDKALISDTIIHIITKEDRAENKITKASEKHIWKFKADNMPDFAFAVSNKYLWDATSLKIGNKRILINAVYSEAAQNFQNVAEISRKTIEFYSNTTPAIPYPYPQFTAFQGGKNGMEFPAIINDQDEDSMFGTQFLTTHEIAHTYFPFLVGTNEQEYSWMDEGLATIIGISALAEISGNEENFILNMASKKYKTEAARLGIDIPPMAGTHSAGDFIYGFMTYIRPITAFSLLYDYLGEEKFYQAITAFIQQWKGKHPIPYDLFYTFNKVAGEDLGWFWKSWFFDMGYADIGIGEIEYKIDKTIINIENIGTFPIPVNLTVKYKDGTKKIVKKDMSIWKSSVKTCKIEVGTGDIMEITLDLNMPEINYENNRKVNK